MTWSELPEPRFDDAAQELDFRSQHLRSDRRVHVASILACTLISFATIPGDFALHGASTVFWTTLVVRGLHVLVTLGLVALLVRTPRPIVKECAVCAWWLASISVMMVLHSTRPPGFQFYVVFQTGVILMIYLLLPNRLRFQVVPALALTAGDSIFMVFIWGDTPDAHIGLTLLGLLVANIAGALGSLHIQRSRRVAYRALLHERAARAELEEALDHVETLEGLLPICGKCKSVRDHKGYWQRIENYLEERQPLRFSHGLCRDCAIELYGDEPWFDLADFEQEERPERRLTPPPRSVGSR